MHTQDTLTSSYLPAATSSPLLEHTVGSLLAERASTHADSLALVGKRHDDGQEVRLSYADLHVEAARVATALRKHSVPGDFVGLWAPNVVEWPIIQYGAAIAGVVLVALNPVLRKAELEYAIRHSGISVLIHAETSRNYNLAEVVTEIKPDFPQLQTISLSDREEWQSEYVDEEVLRDAPTDPEFPVMLQYTSGTTGTPKGVLLKHSSLVNVAHLTMATVEAPMGTVGVNPLPMFHTASCVIGTLGPLTVAGTSILIEQFIPSDALEIMRQEQANLLFYVPTVLSALIEEQRNSDYPAPKLELVIGGASNVPASLITAAHDTFGATVINLYGQTELAPVLTATRPHDSLEDRLTTVGRPLPHVETKIVDRVSGEVVPLGVQGEICARGYQQFIEYLHDPEATARTIDSEGFVHTGDLGSMDSRGYIKVTGRDKELIIRGGENIAPAEIETCLTTMENVVSASVVGLPDERWGEIVAAVVTVREQEIQGLRERLEAHARKNLSPYKVPSRWFVVTEVPLTPTGKVRKFKLVENLQAGSVKELT